VGQKGIRVQAATNELGGERIDIVPWSDNTEELIEAALSPAEGLSVSLNKKEETATVEAPEEQLSLAIGKDGQNVRLASKLTGWRIEIESKGGETKTKKEDKETKEKKTKSKVIKKTKGKKKKDKDVKKDIKDEKDEAKTKSPKKKKKVVSKKKLE
jgi:N utilization substance protein A